MCTKQVADCKGRWCTCTVIPDSQSHGGLSTNQVPDHLINIIWVPTTCHKRGQQTVLRASTRNVIKLPFQAVRFYLDGSRPTFMPAMVKETLLQPESMDSF